MRRRDRTGRVHLKPEPNLAVQALPGRRIFQSVADTELAAVRLAVCVPVGEGAVQAAVHLTGVGTALPAEPAQRRPLSRPGHLVLAHLRGVGFGSVVKLGLLGVAGGAHHRARAGAGVIAVAGRGMGAGGGADRFYEGVHLQPCAGDALEFEDQRLLVGHAVQVGLQLLDGKPAVGLVHRPAGRLAVGLGEGILHWLADDKVGDGLPLRAPSPGRLLLVPLVLPLVVLRTRGVFGRSDAARGQLGGVVLRSGRVVRQQPEIGDHVGAAQRMGVLNARRTAGCRVHNRLPTQRTERVACL